MNQAHSSDTLHLLAAKPSANTLVELWTLTRSALAALAGDCIVDSPPTFGMYRFDADINDARTFDVPRLDDFAIDVAGVEAAVAEHKPKMVFLTSPNNPDGCMLKVRATPALLCREW